MKNESSKDLLKKQALGFAITGSLSTLMMFLLYLAFNYFMNYQLAYFLSYSLSVLAMYFMNVLFVFKTSFSWSGFLQFPLIYVFQYLVGAFSLEFLVRLGIPQSVAPVVVVIILLPITFVLNRLVLARKTALPRIKK